MIVKVTDAPGFEDFEARLLGEIPRTDGVMMSIVACECGEGKEVHAILSEYVHAVSS